MTARVPRRALVCAAVAAAVLSLSRPGLADDWPEWAGAAREPAPSFETKSPAVELLRETVIRFDGSNRYTETLRRVVQIRAREGRSHAIPVVAYMTDGGKVKSLQAWVQNAKGKRAKVDGGKTVDAIDGESGLYDETRVRRLQLPDDADAGSIVAWEGTVEWKAPISQFSPNLQAECPVLRSRVRVETPALWIPRTSIWNHAPVQPTRDGTSYTWELTDLPAIEEEPFGVPTMARAPQIGISMVPAAGGSPRDSMLRWEEVSRWLADLADPQAAVTPALESKARTLTAGLDEPEQKVRAIARYVQGVNYVSVQMGLSRGGGYRPHPASEVLAKNYGDCKDKANLMRTLLRAIGIDSYPVAISAVDPEYVRQEWPSPLQFNHCIIGVGPIADRGACLADVPGLGRIAVFDPTDPSTPWGSLPAREQGALALLVSNRGGTLFRTPEAGPAENHHERAVQAQIGSEGTLTGLLRERASGTSGSDERGKSRWLASADFRKSIEERIGGGLGGVAVTSLQTSEDSTGVFALEAVFEAPRYARPVAGFLTFRLVVAAPIAIGKEWSESRQGPLRLAPYTLNETGRVRLPAGYAVEEVPAPVVVQAPFGTYKLESRLAEGALAFDRSLEIKSRTLSTADYPAARRFFEQVRAAEATQVLLSRR